MEKHSFLNYATRFNHLPGIYNMMHIINMMVFGFVVSQPMFFVIAISSLSKSVQLFLKNVLAKLSGNVNSRYKFLNFVILSIIVLSFVLLNRSVDNLLLVAALLMVLLIINRLVNIKKHNCLPTRWCLTGNNNATCPD